MSKETAAFIRANPTLSPKEIAEKAKEAGLNLSEGTVHNLRSRDRIAAGQRKLPHKPRKKSKKKTAAKSDGKKETKADFIRKHLDKSAKEVVELAKKAGFTLSAAHVYVVQGQTRKKHKQSKNGQANGHAKNGHAIVKKATQVLEAQLEDDSSPNIGGGTKLSPVVRAAMERGILDSIRDLQDVLKRFRG